MYTSVLDRDPVSRVYQTEYITVSAHTYTNPVYRNNFADPNVIKAPDTFYYAYATQYLQSEGSILRDINIQCLRSRNLVNWTFLGDAMPEKPEWSKNYNNVWCPNVNFRNGLFYMYFSAAVNEDQDMGIGVAVSDKPAGPFTTIGEPLEKGHSFEAIDPYLYTFERKNLLYKGSGGKPISVRELDDSLLCFKKDSVSSPVLYPDTSMPFEKALIEGTAVTFREPYHYLYYVGENYTVDNGYAMMVARSLSPFGPFIKKGIALGRPDNTVLKGNNKILSPGPQTIITDELGIERVLYCAQLANDKYNKDGSRKRVLCMDTLEYRDGWPEISDGSPSTTIQNGPYIAVDTQETVWMEF